MTIRYSKRFGRQYRKLAPKIKRKTKSTVDVFRRNPRDPRLRNHSLGGALKGRRSLSVTGDVRIIFEEYDNYTIVIMLDIGTHSKLYR